MIFNFIFTHRFLVCFGLTTLLVPLIALALESALKAILQFLGQ